MPSILEMRDIVKVYPGTVALDKVSVTFHGGEVHAVVGKNGAGKSTLLKIIAGSVMRTSGEMLLDGEDLEIGSPSEAFSLGIATVYQEMSLLPFLSVAENIFLTNMPMRKKAFIDWPTIRKRAKELLEELEIDIDPEVTVGTLSVGQRQMVEIAKAMSTNPKVLQLDEPTSAITTSEVQALFKLVRRLREKGIIVIYVSHRLHELWEIAETCTVLRDGLCVGTVPMQELSREQLLHMMFGDIELRSRPDDLIVEDEVVLKVSNLSYGDRLRDISFELKKGEILGIAGMLGSGRTELLQALFGAAPFDSGEIYCFGKKITKHTPVAMKKIGMAMTPEDRQRQGLVLIQSIARNITTAAIDFLGKSIFFDHKSAEGMIEKQVSELQIKVTDTNFLVSSLSGGNQQKVVVGNWLNTDPKIMLFDEPSRGIDVNAKQQIFQIMWDQARKGISSLMVSTELEELLEVCHRILVIKDGAIIDEILNPEQLSVGELYMISMGGERK